MLSLKLSLLLLGAASSASPARKPGDKFSQGDVSTSNQGQLLAKPADTDLALWIAQNLQPIERVATAKAKRQSHTNINGLGYDSAYNHVSSYWTYESTNYNLTIDVSNCSSGIGFGSLLGPHLFTNGSYSNETILLDVIKDMQVYRPTDDPTVGYRDHLLANIDYSMGLINEVLEELVCQEQIAVLDPPVELRRLLSWTEIGWVLFDTALGGGLAAAGAATIVGLNGENITNHAIGIETAAFVTALGTFGSNMAKIVRESDGVPGQSTWVNMFWLGLANRICIDLKAMLRGQRPPLPVLPITEEARERVNSFVAELADTSRQCSPVSSVLEAAGQAETTRLGQLTGGAITAETFENAQRVLERSASVPAGTACMV